MNAYQFVRLVHIFGALGLFVVLGSEWVIHRILAKARTTGEVQRIMPSLILAKLTGPYSGVFVVLPGLYLTTQLGAWHEAWILASLGAVVSLGILGGAVSGRRLRVIEKESAGEDRPLTPELAARVNEPILWTAFALRATIVLGVVAMMAMHPALPGTVGILVLAVALGLAFGRMLHARS